MVKHTGFCCLVLLFALAGAPAGAQEYNSVPLDHEAYDIIAMGVVRGILLPPASAKPWPEQLVKQKLREMTDDPAQRLSARELDIVVSALESFERTKGFNEGRYWTKGEGFSFEAGFGWESFFSVNASDVSGTAIASVNMAKLYSGGDIADFASWKLGARGGLFYVERTEQGVVSPVFPYTFSKQWDGGVVSLREPENFAAWPDDPALAGAFEAELNGSFFDRRLQLRLGRIRRDWGAGTNGTSLFMNGITRPFTALEGTVSPLPWLHFSFLGGALEYYRQDEAGPDDLFANVLAAGQIELDLLKLLHFGAGGAAVLLDRPNAAFFANLELRLPGLFAMWGSFFVDNLYSSMDNFFSMSENSYAWQAGVRSVVRWLPLGSFTLRYSKVEPYCYSGEWNPPSPAFANGGESLGYYLPPNSDELLLRLDAMPFPALKAHLQYQLMRHGVDYGYGAVGGSSLNSSLDDAAFTKYFLMDGVYRWDDIIKLGASFRFKTGMVPFTIFAETGLVITRFTINGTAGSGNEADYEALDDNVYRAGTGFVFSLGVKLFS